VYGNKMNFPPLFIFQQNHYIESIIFLPLAKNCESQIQKGSTCNGPNFH
jgi:hypothetical protein